jgi:ureidoacrylate peracid hydrolase
MVIRWISRPIFSKMLSVQQTAWHHELDPDTNHLAFNPFRNGNLRAFPIMPGVAAEMTRAKEGTERGKNMTNLNFDKENTALLVIDPYNDFISEGGKIWDRIKNVAETTNTVPHMSQLVAAARQAGLRVFYALHRRYRPGDYESWKYIAPIQRAALSRKTFEYGTWGGEIRTEFTPQPGDIVAQEHWGSSGFANTDLDLLLKRHGIQRLIVIGLIAHTCVESTVRFAAELGYEVTVVKDATADYSDEHMHAALVTNLPSYANAIVTTDEVIESISALEISERSVI